MNCDSWMAEGFVEVYLLSGVMFCEALTDMCLVWGCPRTCVSGFFFKEIELDILMD